MMPYIKRFIFNLPLKVFSFSLDIIHYPEIKTMRSLNAVAGPFNCGLRRTCGG